MIGMMRRSGLMLATMMALGAASPTWSAPPIPARATVQPTKTVRRQQRSALSARAWYGRKGAGISMAQQKRTAAKRRNVARNRQAHR